MASFVMPFVFPFGADGEDPVPTGGEIWLVNLRPAPEETNVRLLRPISFSIRDVGGFVDPANVYVGIGYSKIYGRGEKFFDQAIPNTVRQGLTTPLTNKEPILAIIDYAGDEKAVKIKKVTGQVERSVYFTKVPVDDIKAYRNLMVSTRVQPIIVTNETGVPVTFQGPVFGVEIGPRNTACYVFFKIINGVRKIMLTGPFVPSQTVAPQIGAVYDWETNDRYTLSWNESRGLVQLYAKNNVLIVSAPIDSFPQFDVTSPRHVNSDQYTVVYGIEGSASDEVHFSSISFTDDVSYPVFTNTVRPNDFNSTFRPADLVKTTPGVDPRKDNLSPWYDDNIHFGDEDTAGAAKVGPQGFQLARVTASPVRSVAIFREEPSFLNDDIDGVFVNLHFFGTCTKFDGDAAGFGIVVCDGLTVFKIGCFQKDGIRYVGIFKTGVELSESTLDDDSQFFAEYDWTVPNSLRFTVNGQANRVRLYSGTDLANPILDLLFDRSAFPTATDFDWNEMTPFLAIGHHAPINSAGSIYIQEITYNHVYQPWEGADGRVPEDVSLAPWRWDRADVGGPTIPSEPVIEHIEIACDGTQTLSYSRAAYTDTNRGATLEFKVEISGNDKLESTGDALVLDDGVRCFMVTFTETEEGRFVCLALRQGLGSFQAVAGFDGPGKSLSFRLDWTKPHVYRMERRPFEGVVLFVDNEMKPRIFWPENKLNQLPDTIYSTPTIAFGHFALNAPSVAKWHFVRGFFTSGMEASFKRNATDLVLKDQLFATESIVVVQASQTISGPDGHFSLTGHIDEILMPLVEAAEIELWPVFDFTAMGVTNVVFHILGEVVNLDPGKTITVRWYRGILFQDPLIGVIELTTNGLFHEQVTIAVPVGPFPYLISFQTDDNTIPQPEIRSFTWMVEIS